MSQSKNVCRCKAKTDDVSRAMARLNPVGAPPSLPLLREAFTLTGASLPPRHGQAVVHNGAVAKMIGNWNYRTRIREVLTTPEGNAWVAGVGFCPSCQREAYSPRPWRSLLFESDMRAQKDVYSVFEENPDVERVIDVEVQRVPATETGDKKTVRRFRAQILLVDGRSITTRWWQYQGRKQVRRLLAGRTFAHRAHRFDTAPFRDSETREAFEATFRTEFSARHLIPEAFLRVHALTSENVHPDERQLFKDQYRSADLYPVEVQLVVPSLGDPTGAGHLVDVAHLSRRQLREGTTNPFGFASGVQRDFLRVQTARVPPVREFERHWEPDGNGKRRPKVGFKINGESLSGYRWEFIPSGASHAVPGDRGFLALRDRRADGAPARAFVSLLRVEFEADGHACLKIGFSKEVPLPEDLPRNYAVLAAVGSSYRNEAVSYERYVRGNAIEVGQYRVSVIAAIRADRKTARAIDTEVKRRTRHLREIPPCLQLRGRAQAVRVKPPRGFTEFRTLSAEHACREALKTVAEAHGAVPFEPAVTGLPWSRLAGPKESRVTPEAWVMELWRSRHIAA